MIRIEGIPAVAAKLLATAKLVDAKTVEASPQMRRRRSRRILPGRRQLSRRASR